MARMGHDSAQAAMVYQHKTSEADRAIADALDAKLKKLDKGKKAKKGGAKSGKKKRKKTREDLPGADAGVVASRSEGGSDNREACSGDDEPGNRPAIMGK